MINELNKPLIDLLLGLNHNDKYSNYDGSDRYWIEWDEFTVEVDSKGLLTLKINGTDSYINADVANVMRVSYLPIKTNHPQEHLDFIEAALYSIVGAFDCVSSLDNKALGLWGRLPIPAWGYKYDHYDGGWQTYNIMTLEDLDYLTKINKLAIDAGEPDAIADLYLFMKEFTDEQRKLGTLVKVMRDKYEGKQEVQMLFTPEGIKGLGEMDNE